MTFFTLDRRHTGITCSRTTRDSMSRDILSVKLSSRIFSLRIGDLEKSRIPKYVCTYVCIFTDQSRRWSTNDSNRSQSPGWTRGSRLVQGPTKRLTTRRLLHERRHRSDFGLWNAPVPLHNYVERNVTSLRKQRPGGHAALAKRRPVRRAARSKIKIRHVDSLVARPENPRISKRLDVDTLIFALSSSFLWFPLVCFY